MKRPLLPLTLVLALVAATWPAEAARAVQERVGPPHVHAEAPRGRILMIAANPATSPLTGWPIGCWAAELTHPYAVFRNAGYQVDLASPEGGAIEFDAYSDPRHESGYAASDLLTLGFIHTPSLLALTRSTAKLADVDPARYDAVFLVGGQSPMVTFRGNQALMRFFTDFYESGKPAAAVCHATAILLDARLSNREPLVKGRVWTGFADDEERFAEAAVGRKLQPFWIETEARKLRGTEFRVRPAFTPYAIRDGNLVTGQQQNSGAEAATLVLEVLADTARGSR